MKGLARANLLRGGGLLLLAVVTGCGGDDGGGFGGYLSRLVGVWELRYQSTDNGQTYDEVDNDFEVALNGDQTWNDTDGDAGTWRVQGSQLVIEHDDLSATEYLYFQLEDNDQLLRLFVTDDNGNTNERISLYRRVDIIRGR
ncbi:MAG: hypothetical protein HUU35_09770 [Armatimonadetes bacterium]|nr:hypothetical protein [Armatimonadota bacterium]